ncbi:YncE family protein [Streptomyces sp. NPDC058572]|uniref:YncE family protein n=1 Tax=Streptomyces sp. NPDC058572 TaxID=3346546 RepID=UPI00364FD826
MLGFIIGAMRRELGAVRRRRREITRWTRAWARIAAAGVILALPVTNAALSAAVPAPGTFAYVINTTPNNTVSVVNTKTNLVTDTIPIPGLVGSFPSAAVVNRAGTKLYVIKTSSVSVFDTKTYAVTTVNLLPFSLAGCVDAALNPAGTRLYIACVGTNLGVIDTSNNNVSTIPLGGGSSPRGVAVNPTGTRVYTANSDSDDVTVIDTSNNSASIIDLDGGDINPDMVVVNPSGTRAYVTNGDGSVSTINTAGAGTQILPNVAVGVLPTAEAVSPDGTRLYVTVDGTPDTVVVFDTTTTPISVVGAITTGISIPRGVAFNPAGTFAYVTNAGGSPNLAAIDTVLLSVTDTVPVSNPFGVAVGAVPGTTTASCPGGKFMTGGGAELTGPEPSYFSSKPVNDTWEVSLTNPTNQDITVRPYAVCSDPA